MNYVSFNKKIDLYKGVVDGLLYIEKMGLEFKDIHQGNFMFNLNPKESDESKLVLKIIDYGMLGEVKIITLNRDFG